MRSVLEVSLLFFVTLLTASCRNKSKPSTEPTSAEPAPSPALSAVEEGRRHPPKAHRRKKSSAPPLPVVAKQDKPKEEANVHPQSKAYPCGSVHVGGDEIPLACVDPNEIAADAPSRVVIPYASMPGRTEALPRSVDHRENGMEGPTRNQGRTPACTAFATTSALDHALALWTGKVEPISVMQVWGEYHAANQNVANVSIMGRAFGPESAWPFDQGVARSWEAPDKCGNDRDRCGKPVDSEKLGSVSIQGIVVVTQIEKLWGRRRGAKGHEARRDVPFELMRARLAGGRDLLIGLTMPTHFKPIAAAGDTSGTQYIPDDLEWSDAPGGHFISMVGYSVVDDGTYFLLKNSWGKKWGQDGYAWIHDATLSKMMASVFAIDAEPSTTVGLRNVLTKSGPASRCPAGQAPDASTTVCSLICPGGGPTNNGTCGETEGCEPGQINLIGECVAGAPELEGIDANTTVGFDCAISGCIYSLPSGFAGCKDHCQKSCPAPDFRLAQGPAGLTCIE